ncbi:MAG: asparagine synthase C-terminal domain-containing protein [Candidatus Omnitrophica bacterium]|nr:asparagine synthase C-terminal domain-containing protein [Candidatus Omnitrophota bacterium]
MNRIVGFSLAEGLDQESQNSLEKTLDKALQHFPWLHRLSIRVGRSELIVWGHGKLSERLHRGKDGVLYVIIGSPIGGINWQEIEENCASKSYKPSWDGRFILIKISLQGSHWTMWNDWIGGIPVFHSFIGKGCLACTLETVVVSAGGFTSKDLFLPGLISLLVNGHLLGEWTIFKNMKVVRADCCAERKNEGFVWERLNSVQPSGERWNKGWDELVDEMHILSREAVASVLKNDVNWVLPLSGGVDSRLIAGIGCKMGVNFNAYTYGPSNWNEVIFASKVAKALKLKWKRIDFGRDYLAEHTKMWADWFGSALHFHGMYQMPFLNALKNEPQGRILHGYMGDPLAGNHANGLLTTHSESGLTELLTKSWVHWSAKQVKGLLKFPVGDAIEEVKQEIEKEIDSVKGAFFQRLMFLDFWNRQRLFIYYQPAMYDYYRGVETPFLNREYAKFCMSLPLLALEGRRLQAEMLRKHYYNLAEIPGTYSSEPYILTGKFLLKRKIGAMLPRFLRIGTFEQFSSIKNTFESDCIKERGKEAIWPIYEKNEYLSEWFNMDKIDQAYDRALKGDLQSVIQLTSVQAIAYRLLSAESRER